MRDKTPAEVIRFLGLHQFLATQHQEMLERDVARYVQTEQLLDEILANGWITPFQHRLICDGQEERLLVGPYRILEQIGEGGMGVVYKAVYPKLNRLVALKIIQPHLLSQRPELIHRFEREARAAAQLMHPNVVVLYDAGNAGNIYFLAMEYVEGVTLDRLVRMQGPLPIKQATDYIRQAALGLQHAYDQGLVHRDIKPGNLLVAQRAPNSGGSSGRRSSSLIRRPILITQRDKKLALDSSNNPANHRGINSWGVVKILDMGLARIRDSFDDYSTDQPLTPLTRVGTLLGTPDFIAPEQARDPRGVDIRADLYSLGCSFYFLLSGRPPFSGGNDVQKIIRHQNERPVAIEELRPHLPEVITQVINRLLQKNPDDRYEVPQDLADELQAFLLRPPTTGAIAQESKVTASDVMLPAEVAQSFNPMPAMQPLNPTQRVATPQPPTLFGKPEMDPVTVHSLGSESSVSPESGRVEVPQNGRTASPQALRRLGIFNAHMGAVTGVSVTADGRMAASCGVDGRFRIWDLTAVPEPRETAASARPGCELETIAFHPDAAGVVIGGLQQGNAFVWFWDSREDAFFDWGAFSTSLSRGVGATAFAGDGKMFAAAIGSFVITWKTNGRVATSRSGEGPHLAGACLGLLPRSQAAGIRRRRQERPHLDLRLAGHQHEDQTEGPRRADLGH